MTLTIALNSCPSYLLYYLKCDIMKKLFSLHSTFNAKRSIRFLLNRKLIPILILIPCIHLPSGSFAGSNLPNSKLFHLEAVNISTANFDAISDIRVTGIVRDEKGNPMVGVSVVVQGQATGVSTSAAAQERMRERLAAASFMAEAGAQR